MNEPVYTNAEIKKIKKEVAKRDDYRCVIHGTKGIEIHELLQRSSSTKNAKFVFNKKYMASLCPDCHTLIHHGTVEGANGEIYNPKNDINLEILLVLKERFGYRYLLKDLKSFGIYKNSKPAKKEYL